MRPLARLLGPRLAGPAWALTAELAWHLLGAAWAFTVLVLAVGWLAGRLPAAMATAAAATAKAAAVENRVDALVPAVNDAKDAAAAAQTTANSAQSDANTALNTIPDNHSFLSGLTKAYTGSVSTGADAGTPPSVNAAVSGSCPNPPTQAYVNALAGNVNDLRDDVIGLRTYMNSFATTYNQTQWCLQYVQDQLLGHGYSYN